MLSRLFTQYRDVATRRKVRNITLLSFLLLAVGVLFVGIVPLSAEDTNIRLLSAAIGAVQVGAGVLILWLVYQNSIQYAEWVAYVAILLPPIVLVFGTGASFDTVGLAWIGTSIFILTVSGPRGVVFYGALGMIGIPLAYVLRDDTQFSVANMMAAEVIFVAVIAITWIAANDLMIVVKEIRSEAEDRRLRLIETTNAVSSRIFSRLELETLLNETVEIIREQFDPIYHAQVFLVDATGNTAVLRASTGEIGRQLMQRHHHLGVGSQSVIGQVTLQNTYVMASDTSSDPVHRRNELLPDTRTELALPLCVRDEVIGALDLQSRIPNAFTVADIEILQTLADQIAIAIENARLIDQAQAAAAENLRLLQQEQTSRQEIERLNQELVGRAWQRFLREQSQQPNLTVELDSGAVANSVEQTSSMIQAKQTGELVIQPYADGQRVAVPINVRGATLGVIEFDIESAEPISQSLRAALVTISERLGIVAENTRLFETAQAAVNYQEQLNQISAGLQGITEVDELLSTVLRTLGKTMGAQTGYVRLVPTKPGNGGGQPPPTSVDDEWVDVS